MTKIDYNAWHSGPCIDAPGKPGTDGYGKKKIKGITYRAHRVAYCQHHGLPIDAIKGLVVMHMCDRPPCINPLHLKLGTNRENIDDMMAKGRQLKGENNNTAVLTEDAIRTIRALYKKHSQDAGAKFFAQMFGVHRRTINQIVLRQTWRHVT